MHADQLFLLLAIVQLILEYQSISLFLWPLNHSCAKPPIASPALDASHTEQAPDNYAFNDSRLHPVDPDAIQLILFDATPEDPYTLARADSLGISYDDISRCFEYPIESSNGTDHSTLNTRDLETCQYGLKFEQPQQSISIIGFFQLACSRKYRTIFLPNSFGLGLILGIILTYYLIMNLRHRRSCSSNNATTDEHIIYYWFLVQIVASLMVQINTYSLSGASSSSASGVAEDDNIGRYIQFVCCVLLRSFNATSNLTGIIFLSSGGGGGGGDGDSKQNLYPEISYELLRNNHRNFLLFSALFVAFKALFPPLALRMFASWSHLNECLTVYSFCCTMAIFMWESYRRYSIANRRSNGINFEDVYRENRLQMRHETHTSDPVVSSGGPGGNNSKAPASVAGEQATRGGLRFPVCEFCSIHPSNEHQMSAIRGSLSDTIAVSEGDSIDNPYAPTTAPAHLTAIGDSNLSRDTSIWLAGNQVYHSLSFAHQALLNRSNIVQLIMLTFCVAFNYFLIQFVPDHKLMHSESIASRLDRKLIHISKNQNNHSESIQTKNNHSESIQPTNFLYSLTNDERQNASQASDDKNHVSKGVFDFGSINRATQSMEIMQNSMNPLEILWTTMRLNSWPVELAVFLLHLNRLSNFKSSYFKLKRLFTLVKFGARILILEWLVIAIIKRQHHLLEWDWLYSLALLVANFTSVLMLFNFLNTMLELSGRLVTNKLLSFLPSALVSTLALMLASYAPMLENLDLAIIPIALVSVNLATEWLARNMSDRFKSGLCPMIFEELTTAQTTIATQPITTSC